MADLLLVPSLNRLVSTVSLNRIFLNSTYADRGAVSKLGAQYDETEKGWWISDNIDRTAFRKWLPRMYRPGASPPHLTCELIPTNTWFMNLRKWLPKNEWDRVRKKTYQQAGYRCLVCGGKGPKWPVECNEQWQYSTDSSNPKAGIQKLLRLAALCPTCHSVKHAGYAGLHGKLGEALRQLGFVNGWNEEQCDAHLEEAASIHFRRSQMTWSFDLSLLKDYDVEKLDIDLAEHITVPNFLGIGLRFKNISSLFNSLSMPFVSRRIAKCSQRAWLGSKWRQITERCPIGALDVVREDEHKFKLIDCTTPYYLSDYHIDSLRDFISEATVAGYIALLFSVADDKHENNSILAEAVDAAHPRYMKLEFEDRNLRRLRIAMSKTEKYTPLENFLDILKTTNAFQTSADLEVGLEFVRTHCKQCDREIYRFSGLVVPTTRVKNWQSEEWKYSNHIPLGSISPKMLDVLIAEVSKYTEYDGIPLTQLELGARSPIIPICPYCPSEQRVSQMFGSDDDHARFGAIGENNARVNGRLAYFGAKMEIDYLTMRAIAGSFECSQYSDPESSPISDGSFSF